MINGVAVMAETTKRCFLHPGYSLFGIRDLWMQFIVALNKLL